MGVTSGPLLPLLGPGWHEERYDCIACALNGRPSYQYVMFGPGDTPPPTLRLPCYGAGLDIGGLITHWPQHLYRRSEAPQPAEEQ